MRRAGLGHGGPYHRHCADRRVLRTRVRRRPRHRNFPGNNPSANMLRYHTIPVTPFQQNCSIVWCDQTMEGAVIDPGGDLPLIRAAVAAPGRDAQADPAHARTHRPCRWHGSAGARAGAAHRRPSPGRPVLDRRPAAAGADVRVARRPSLSHRRAGCTMAIRCAWETARSRCAIAPGTRPGMSSSTVPRPVAPSLVTCFSPAASAAPICPAETIDTLLASITQRLWPMGDDTVFIPGHGPESSFGRERRTNPFVGGT